jgi:hypothetical protein
MLEELVLIAAVAGLVWYSKRKAPIRGEMCSQGFCETRTTRSIAPPEQQILLDTPVNTAGRDDRTPVSDANLDAILRIRKSVLNIQQDDANGDPGVALGSPAVI